MMLILEEPVAVAMLLSIWLLLQEEMLMETLLEAQMETTIAMPTMLEEFGVQRWILWKLTFTIGKQLLTFVMLQTLTVTSATVIELDVEKVCTILIQTLMDQAITTESTL